jgi:hypothetical protein
MYKLKEKTPDFQCCDGPLEGRKFVAGQMYPEIPPEEAGKFEEVKTEEMSQGAGRKAQAKNATEPPREV